MNQEQLTIRAKKISELDNFLDYHQTPDENTFIIVGYNNGRMKQNYKIDLPTLLSMNSNIDIENALEHIQDQIDDLQNQINIYHGATFSINYNLSHITIGESNPTSIRAGEECVLYFNTDTGYDMPNEESIIVTGGQYEYNQSEKTLRIYNPISNINITINAEPKLFTISYDLENILSINNPSVLRFGEEYILHFEPELGYELPGATVSRYAINVIGCDYTYNQSEKTIYIYNITDNVIVSMYAIAHQFRISYHFTHINYNVTYNNKSTYVKGDRFTVVITAEYGYKLPVNLTLENCSLDIFQEAPSNEDITRSLNIICDGTANMIVSGEAISTLNYYFGFESNASGRLSDLEFSTTADNVINGIISVTIDDLSNLSHSNYCPFTTELEFTVNGLGSPNSVDRIYSLLIVPVKYFDINRSEFIDDNNNRYILQPVGFPFQITFMYWKIISIDGVDHYVICYGEGLRNGQKLIITHAN